MNYSADDYEDQMRQSIVGAAAGKADDKKVAQWLYKVNKTDANYAQRTDKKDDFTDLPKQMS
jgi:hypothetical protein